MYQCFKCLRELGLTVSAPQILVVNIGCNTCGSEKVKSYSVDEVRKQAFNKGG